MGINPGSLAHFLFHAFCHFQIFKFAHFQIGLFLVDLLKPFAHIVCLKGDSISGTLLNKA